MCVPGTCPSGRRLARSLPYATPGTFWLLLRWPRDVAVSLQTSSGLMEGGSVPQRSLRRAPGGRGLHPGPFWGASAPPGTCSRERISYFSASCCPDGGEFPKPQASVPFTGVFPRCVFLSLHLPQAAEGKQAAPWALCLEVSSANPPIRAFCSPPTAGHAPGTSGPPLASSRPPRRALHRLSCKRLQQSLCFCSHPLPAPGLPDAPPTPVQPPPLCSPKSTSGSCYSRTPLSGKGLVSPKQSASIE